MPFPCIGMSRYERREGDDICALFLLDLDHFKDVNDTLSHIAGDQVLRETGLILKSCIRSTDLAGRLGGDEFVLFIQNVSNVQGLDRCAKKLVSALKRTYKNEQQSITVSTSIGIVPDVYLCTGRLWVATDPSTNMYLRVHQRIATIFRWAHERMYCCHIHISNPYSEMHEEDVGFPTQMGEQSCQYMQESIEKHKKQLEAETRMLERMSFEDLLTGLFNRNKYHQSINHFNEKTVRHIGVACFDLNGLKMMNDSQGHSAGDRLLCCAAEHFKRVFPGKAYRIGGDEFVVMDTELGEEEFHKSVQTLRKNMMKDNISISAGISWRSSECGREKLHQGFT